MPGKRLCSWKRLVVVCGWVWIAAGSDRAAGGEASWPMLGHDLKRSGSTADEIRPPFERKWYRLFGDEGIMTGVQPVIRDGTVYVPTLRGNLHALDAESGADKWVFSAGSAVLHTAATDGTMVFIGCADGKIEAVQAATGKLAWSVSTAAAVWNSPVLFEETAIAGSRDGKLYAMEAKTGRMLWVALTDGPVLSSPAIDPERRRVYVGCEDMRVYAFDFKTGERIWVSRKLPGVSLRGYYPVIAPDGTVMVTVEPGMSLDRFNPILLEMVKEIFGDFASWRHSAAENEKWRKLNFEQLQNPETFRKELEYLRWRLMEQPSFQTFFALDFSTGKQKFVAPIIYAESMNGPGAPAIVTAGGKVIVKFQALLRSRYEHYSPFLNVGYLDTTNGWITPAMDESRTYGWHDSLLLVHDEQSQLMAAGGILINTHQDNVNAMDLRTRQGFAQPFCRNIHEPAPGEALGIWAKLWRGGELPDGKEWLARGTAVYGGGSVLDVSVSVAGDSFYYLPTHEINSGAAVIAYRMAPQKKGSNESPAVVRPELAPEEWDRVQELPWDWDTLEMPRLDHVMKALPGEIPGTRSRPLSREAEERVRRITDEELDHFIWDSSSEVGAAAGARSEALGEAGAKSKARLRSDLERACREWLSIRWRPLVFPAGKFPEETYRFFDDPSESLYTMALAYPLVSAAMQSKLRENAGRLLDGGMAGLYWQKSYPAEEGLVRTLYSAPPESVLRIREIPKRTLLARLYPLWLWDAKANDGKRVDAIWKELKKGIDVEGARPAVEDCGNSELAGLIAFCRMAKEMNDAGSLEKGLAAARRAMRERLKYEFAMTRGGVIGQVPVQRSIFVRWNRMTPAVGRLIGAYAREIEQSLMERYVDYHRPTWWLAWNVELMMRNECPFSFPTISQQVFSARALVLGEKGGALAKWVDIPWCKADEFYIQKLALTIGAE